MAITLSDETKTQAVASIRRYFSEQLDQEVGDLQAGLLLDFVLKEIAPSVYGDRRRFLASVSRVSHACR